MNLKSIEATGKTVKDAIRNGCEALGCDAENVEIQVLEMGSPGIFGMFGKPAKVKLTVKGKADDFNLSLDAISLEREKKAKPEPKKAEPKPEAKPAPKAKPEPKPEVKPEPVEEAEEAEEAEDGEETPAKPKRRRSRNRKHKAEAPAEENAAEEKPAAVPAPAEPETPFVVTDEGALTEEAKNARAFLTRLTELIGVPVSCEICETEDNLRIRMSGDNMNLLIGRRGDTLDALQYLTNLNVNRGREGYLRVTLDTEDYRARREESLRKLAVRMASRAKKSGRRVVMEPMNPYERRILHSALQNDPEVETHSEGEEPNRRVIITLTK